LSICKQIAIGAHRFVSGLLKYLLHTAVDNGGFYMNQFVSVSNGALNIPAQNVVIICRQRRYEPPAILATAL
jgi:hypothetical protein